MLSSGGRSRRRGAQAVRAPARVGNGGTVGARNDEVIQTRAATQPALRGERGQEVTDPRRDQEIDRHGGCHGGGPVAVAGKCKGAVRKGKDKTTVANPMS